MKKLLLITGLALALASCGGKSNKVENQVYNNKEKTNNEIDLNNEIEKVINSANSMNDKLDQEETNVYDVLGKCDNNIHKEIYEAHPLGMRMYHPDWVAATRDKGDAQITSRASKPGCDFNGQQYMTEDEIIEQYGKYYKLDEAQWLVNQQKERVRALIEKCNQAKENNQNLFQSNKISKNEFDVNVDLINSAKKTTSNLNEQISQLQTQIDELKELSKTSTN